MNSFIKSTFLLFPLFTLCTIQAQDLSGPLAKGCSLGLDIGYNESELYGSFKDEINEGSATDYEPSRFKAVGKNAKDFDLTVYLKLYKFFYVKTGLGYTQHGGKFLNTRLSYPVDVTLDYLNVPVGVGVNPVVYGPLSVALDIGFQFSQELSSEQEFVKGIGPRVHQNRFVSGYFWSGSVIGSISSRWAIRASYRYTKALRPFHENEIAYGKWDGLELSSKATAFSGGIIFVLK
ncbi:hypothetical protein [Parachryseolinea silvisoli]|uniref:hypothetical protein n=1 Tax=Parachryseolinea silvisoli TaxID=2873601 RepID=UPI002265F8BD|nr:hypothetical protein [Parachryseolinea silvisoli]MCD9015470.1 hypothetical protein [Parachryseolinea silvisoli]